MSRINIGEAIDKAPFRKFHYSLFLWCFIVLVLDGYDLAIAGAALPAIMADMKVDATTAGFMASSALFGMMFGGMLLGTLADRIGRRRTIALSVFLFSFFTCVAGFASDPIVFSILRFFAGLGIGGGIPIVTAHMSEYTPKRTRGFTVTLMCCGYAIGSILAALIGKGYIASHGWQVLFFMAGFPVLILPFLLKYMPESVSYLLRTEDAQGLRRLYDNVAPGQSLSPDTTFYLAETSSSPSAPVAMLFRNGRALSTLMFWLTFITCLFMLYAISTWLVKLMSMAGYSLGSALTFLMVYNAGAIFGAVGGGWLADRLNIKYVLSGFFATSVVSLVALGYGFQPTLIIIAIVGASTLGTQILCYAYVGQYYPASIRSTGVGFASGIGRFGAMLAPIIIGILVSMKLPLFQNFIAIACAGAIGAVAVLCINHRLSASSKPQFGQAALGAQ